MKGVFCTACVLLALLTAVGCAQSSPGSTVSTDTPASEPSASAESQQPESSEEEYVIKPLTIDNGVIPLDDMHIRELGRTYSRDGWWYMSQNNAGFEIRMEGTSLSMEVKLNDDVPSTLYPLIKIFVDDEEEDTMQLNGNGVYTLVEGLPEGQHIVKVIKVSESSMGSLAVRNLTMNADGTLYTPPQAKARRIEFIGDSITTSYGNVGLPSESNYLSRDEDSSQGYAAMVAEHYDADVRIVAGAGRGLVRNNTGDTNLLPSKLFEEYDVWNSDPYPHEEWIPQVVVINLGTNDGSAGVTQEEFLNAGKKFIRTIRSKSADAQIVWAYGVMGKTYEETIRTMVEQMNSEGDTKVHCVIFDDMADNEHGALGHPNVAGHRTMADRMIAEMDQFVQW